MSSTDRTRSFVPLALILLFTAYFSPAWAADRAQERANKKELQAKCKGEARFIDNGDGTVLDCSTKLIWTKNADLFGEQLWSDAVASCGKLADDKYSKTPHGLSDGSRPGDWKLPSVKELISLIDYSQHSPPLPAGHPFENVRSTEPSLYWTSTQLAGSSIYAWRITLTYGNVGTFLKNDGFYHAWCVRRMKND